MIKGSALFLAWWKHSLISDEQHSSQRTLQLLFTVVSTAAGKFQSGALNSWVTGEGVPSVAGPADADTQPSTKHSSPARNKNPEPRTQAEWNWSGSGACDIPDRNVHTNSPWAAKAIVINNSVFWLEDFRLHLVARAKSGLFFFWHTHTHTRNTDIKVDNLQATCHQFHPFLLRVASSEKREGQAQTHSLSACPSVNCGRRHNKGSLIQRCLDTHTLSSHTSVPIDFPVSQVNACRDEKAGELAAVTPGSISSRRALSVMAAPRQLHVALAPLLLN